MKVISIDIEKCEGCGSCEERMPGIHREVNAWGKNGLQLDDILSVVKIKDAKEAQKFCRTGAFTIEDI